jgi:hypothetical protein
MSGNFLSRDLLINQLVYLLSDNKKLEKCLKLPFSKVSLMLEFD